MVLSSSYAEWKSATVTLVVIIAAVCSLVFNILFIFLVVKSKYMKKPANLFLLNLALADILGAVFWALPAVVAAATWEWKLGTDFCKVQGFFGMFSFSLNMYSFTVIAFEKFMKIVIPKRHEDAFNNYTVTLVVMGALWLLSLVVSFMPLIGWGTFKFYSYQMQCATDFVRAYSLLNFFVVCVLVLPTLASLVFYIVLFIRVGATLKKNAKTKDGKFVLHERKDAAGDSYAERMKIQQSKFKVNKISSESKKKKKKKKRKSDDNDEGYGSDKCYHSSDSSGKESSDEEFYNDYEDYRIKKREEKTIRDRKKIYIYKKQYLQMAITMIITMAIYVALWVPFVIVTYTWAFHPTSVKEGSYIIFTLVTFFGISYKQLIYLTNSQVRTSVRKAFRCRRKKKKMVYGEARGENTMKETRTVREIHHTEEHVETTTTTRTYTNERTEQPSREATIAWEETKT